MQLPLWESTITLLSFLTVMGVVKWPIYVLRTCVNTYWKGQISVQELSRLRSRNLTCNDTLATLEIELRTCRENLERAIADKECLQRQSASQLLDLDRLKQDKDALELHQRVTERELMEAKDKLVASTRSLGSAGTNLAQQEATICQLRGKRNNKVIN